MYQKANPIHSLDQPVSDQHSGNARLEEYVHKAHI